MRRAAKGGTTHPSVARPGYGFGRPLRPRPDKDAAPREWWVPSRWVGAPDEILSQTRVVAERS